MRGLGIILLGMLGAGVAGAGSPGYLPGSGPAPLRFQSPGLGARVVLPPLQIQGDLPSLAPTSAGATSPPAERDPVVLGPEARALSSPSTNLLNQVSTNSLSLDLPNENNAVISPQMFLRFFTASGTGAGREASVIMPPGFNPARPGPPASSSATYTSPKP